jgi:hypothetical protein
MVGKLMSRRTLGMGLGLVVALGSLGLLGALRAPEAQGESHPEPSIAGVWGSDYGVTMLTQRGSKIEGSIQYPNGHTAALTGTFTCLGAQPVCLLDYTWGDGQTAGSGYLHLSPDGSALSGPFRALRAKGGARLAADAADTWTLHRGF